MNVLILSPFNEEIFLQIKNLPNLCVERCLSIEEFLKKDLSQIEILVIRSTLRVDLSLLEKLPRLRLLLTCTIGFDHLDLIALKNRNIVVSYTPQAHVQAASELTLALMLACARRIPSQHRRIKSGEWRQEILRGFELSQKTLGVVGLGRIGQNVSLLARTFGMNVISFDPYQTDHIFNSHAISRVSYEELLKLSDVVTFHVPATRKTRHMLSASEFEYLKRGQIIINTSRGAVIKEEDLYKALEEGWVKAAGLDVFEKEPLPRDSSLLRLDQVVLSPHIGSMTFESLRKSSEEARVKIQEFLITGSCSDLLPPDADWYKDI